MGAVVTFDPTLWLASYPEFDQTILTAPVLQRLFRQATLYQANDGSGPIDDVTEAATLLDMLVAHLAFIEYGTTQSVPGGGSGGSPVVGRISGAAQGSVSFQTENQYPPGTAQWFQQSKYGSAWYAATMAYRTMRYITKFNRFGPNPYGRKVWF